MRDAGRISRRDLKSSLDAARKNDLYNVNGQELDRLKEVNSVRNKVVSETKNKSNGDKILEEASER